MKQLSIFILLVLPILSFSQEMPEGMVGFPIAITKAESSWDFAKKEVSTEVIKKHLEIIASDEMEGRETGTKGQKKAAIYIINQLKNSGVKPNDADMDYRQNVLFKKSQWGKTSLSVNEVGQKLLRNFYCFTSNFNPTKLDISKVSFLGYGLKNDIVNNYKKKPKSNIGIIFSGQPRDSEGKPIFKGLGSKETSFVNKSNIAKEMGIDVLFIIDENFKKNAANFNRFILNPRFRMLKEDKAYTGASVIWISPTLAEEIFGKKLKKVIHSKSKINRDKRFRTFDLPSKINMDFDLSHKTINSANLVAFIEGNDPVLKEEVLVISAHYDHLGKRGKEIFNGADDNGSGTSATLTIAQALQKYKDQGNEFKRSVQIIFFTGEEKGLLGSQYYTENPIIPLENIITDLNIDMIGRVDKEHADDHNYVYVIGSDKLSMDLHASNESMNKKYTQLDLDYKYNDENDPNRFYYRSDHYNFAKNGIPIIFYFSGVHDDYHQPSDTVDKILFDKAAKISKLCFMTALDLINAKHRPSLIEK